MNRILFTLLFFALLFLSANSRAAVTAFGSLSLVSVATTNSVSVQTNTSPTAVGTFIIANGGLPNTNALTGQRQFSLDGVNWTSIGTAYTPSVTNANGEAYGPAVLNIPIYTRLSVTTTSNVLVGAVYVP